MAPLEPWEKVLVDLEAFEQTAHGKATCVDCHAGDETASDKATAHQGLVTRPSADPGTYCAACHQQVTDTIDQSLHVTQAGYWTAIDARSVPENHPALEEMFGNHCASCHTTCGDCHVSQPNSVGGGLLEGHVFVKTPSLTRNCTACHGSRVGNEYMGKNEGYNADVHFRQGRMKCTDCHTADEMHGNYAALGFSETPNHRYAGIETPQCTQCHDLTTMSEEYALQHAVHYQKLECQVCHSVAYKSCDGCHVSLSEETGKPKFATEGSYMTFFIGRNPLQSEARPYEYVVLRHVPASPTSYEFYGENLLPNFDAAPTWTYATPHNIQRQTPQNQACENCHGNAEIFLTGDKVAAGELTANQAVILDAPVPPVDALLAEMPKRSAEHANFGDKCLACHAPEGNAAPPADHTLYTEAMCGTCHLLEGQ